MGKNIFDLQNKQNTSVCVCVSGWGCQWNLHQLNTDENFPICTRVKFEGKHYARAFRCTPFTPRCHAPSSSLRGTSLRCVSLRASAQTSKHFIQDLMAANGADNTLARVEMETSAVGAGEREGVCLCVCPCVCAKKRHGRLIEPLHHYSLTEHMPRAS